MNSRLLLIVGFSLVTVLLLALGAGVLAFGRTNPPTKDYAVGPKH